MLKKTILSCLLLQVAFGTIYAQKEDSAFTKSINAYL